MDDWLVIDTKYDCKCALCDGEILNGEKVYWLTSEGVKHYPDCGLMTVNEPNTL